MRRQSRRVGTSRKKNDDLGLASNVYNAKYRRKQKEDQINQNSVFSRLVSMQRAMQVSIVPELFQSGLSLAAVGRRAMFKNLSYAGESSKKVI